MKNGVDAQKDAVLGILLNDGHKVAMNIYFIIWTRAVK